VKFRVGAPPALPLPLWTIPCYADRRFVCEALETDLVDGTINIIASEGLELREVDDVWFSGHGIELCKVDDVELDGHGIELPKVDSVELVGRGIAGDDSEGQPTILIVAEWDEKSPPLWERIVKRTKKWIDEKVLASGKLNLDIAVEMIARDLTLCKHVSAISERELAQGLGRDWPNIADKVAEILERHPATESKVTSISLFRLGSSEDLGNNPLTVYISVSYESDETKWPPVVTMIEQYLSAYQHDLHVHLEHNSFDLHPSFPILLKNLTKDEILSKLQMFNFDPDRRYSTSVKLGDDIGPARYVITKDGGEKAMPGVGTLGCWVEIKTKTNTQWTKYALTNYHVVRPAIDGFRLGFENGSNVPGTPVKGSDVWAADLDGICPKTNFSSPPAQIEHPTRMIHCFTVQLLNHEIARNSPSPARDVEVERLGAITAFFDQGNPIFGTIYCASGYRRRTANNGRLDWALIRPIDPGRVGKNTLPTEQDWTNKGVYVNVPKLRVMGKSLQQPPMNGLLSTQSGQDVFKVGASTGPTAGELLKVKSHVSVQHDRHVNNEMGGETYYSNEFMFIGNPRSAYLAYHGDSGSVAFDEEGRAVGLVFRGLMAQQAANSYTFITPIEDVFADIRAFSKGGITDIRIAED
jgi:hypothetical protein